MPRGHRNSGNRYLFAHAEVILTALMRMGRSMADSLSELSYSERLVTGEMGDESATREDGQAIRLGG